MVARFCVRLIYASVSRDLMTLIIENSGSDDENCQIPQDVFCLHMRSRTLEQRPLCLLVRLVCRADGNLSAVSHGRSCNERRSYLRGINGSIFVAADGPTLDCPWHPPSSIDLLFCRPVAGAQLRTGRRCIGQFYRPIVFFRSYAKPRILF